MSFVTQPISLNYATKADVTVTTSAGTSQKVGQITGPIQARIVNYDTVRVAYMFGTKTKTDAITVATAPTLPPGAVEIITISPNADTTDPTIYWNIIGDSGAAGNKFEVTLGSGY